MLQNEYNARTEIVKSLAAIIDKLDIIIKQNKEILKKMDEGMKDAD